MYRQRISLIHCKLSRADIFLTQDGRRRLAEAPVAAERAFNCGNNKYYVVECYGYFIVQRQDWLGRTFISYAHSLAEAIGCIEADARCWQIRVA
jgi:hypothetical protein